MKYVIGIIEDRLVHERMYFEDATTLLAKVGSRPNDIKAYETSLELAKERIPQLEKALNLLKAIDIYED